MEWIAPIVLALAVGAFLWLTKSGGVSEAAARDYLRQGAKVIDVRGPAEFQSGHLPNAVNIPLGELREKIASLAPGKDDVLLLHCLSGGRSGMGQRVLKQMGYTRVFNLGSYRRAERIVSGV